MNSFDAAISKAFEPEYDEIDKNLAWITPFLLDNGECDLAYCNLKNFWRRTFDIVSKALL